MRKQINDNKKLLDEIAELEATESGSCKCEQIAQPHKRGCEKPVDKPKRKKKDHESLESKKSRLLSPAAIVDINKRIQQTKSALKEEIDKNIDIDRYVRQEALVPSNIVSIFDSNLTRCLNMSTTSLNDELVIVKVYYFGVAENIIKKGFYMNGEHYVFFSASAGQIRTKKFVAIKESSFDQCRNALTCGLSDELMNAQGGININKYLAYLALCNSATTLWDGFDINRCIVIDDFETMVHGIVDFIDEKKYTIERREMDIPITHTDGCGMILPQLSKVNFMVRAPWVKGLLASFPFDKFIKEADKKHPGRKHGIIKDIYGVEHDVLKEKIQVIFTKSMFKTYKYFPDWKTYQGNFRTYGCTAGKCNEEPKHIDNAKFNYQMLQTLTDLSDEELSTLCEKTNRKLRDMTSDRATMLQVFGATKQTSAMNGFQKCLAYYPELLQDPYCKCTLRDLKDSIERRSLAGRLDIDGKYLFLIPDLYAACQYWFLGEGTPRGLLSDGEVYCRVYDKNKELDVLRSPHLYKEHAIRYNVASERPEIKEWFRTDGIYTSSFDLISKILQFDVDGDRALVVADRTIIEAAKRNCADVVPLYYEMAKAGAVQITPENKYDGMLHAWTGGNIGSISNQII